MWSSDRYLPVLLIGGLVGLVYANSLHNSFHYDDQHAIVENFHLRSLENIPAFFVDPGYFSRDPDKAMYRPLLLVTLALNYAWSGAELYSYHLVNIALHALCSLLLWRILLELGRAGKVAVAGGLIFALHPVCTEPVNYISSRSELLMAFFALAGFWLYQLSWRRGKWTWLAASLLCFVLGLLSKSVAIVLPALLAAADYAAGRWSVRVLGRYAPYWAVALAYGGLVRGFVHKALLDHPVRSMAQQLGTQAKAIPYYLKLLAMPTRLSVHHQFFASAWDGAVLASGLLLASLVLWAGAALRRRPEAVLGGGWMLIALAPTILVPLYVMVNDHRLYLPLAGLVIFLSYGAGWMGRATRIYAGLMLVVFSLLVVQRNRVWEDEYTLWTDAARKSPTPFVPVAYIHLGNYAREHGALEEAIGYYRRALEIAPDHLAARNNLANVYQAQGRYDRAAALYQSLLADEPQLAEARYNLAKVYQAQGRYERAYNYYRSVPQESYHYDLALNNMGTIHEQSYGRPDSALFYYGRALAFKMDSPEAAANFSRLGQSLIDAGRAPLVEGVCRRVLAAQARVREARFFLAVSLFVQRRYSESIAENRRLVEDHPGFGEGYLQLANALESSGQDAAARRIYEALIEGGKAGEVRRLARQRLRRLLRRPGP